MASYSGKTIELPFTTILRIGHMVESPMEIGPGLPPRCMWRKRSMFTECTPENCTYELARSFLPKPKPRRSIEKKCSKCGADTVERVNKRTGDRFWGCAMFPGCKGSWKPARRYIEHPDPWAVDPYGDLGLDIHDFF